MTDIWYCTREEVKSALDIKESARNTAQIDYAISSGARAIEDFLHRKFYPLVATRYFDFPSLFQLSSYRLWLDEQELISLTSITAGGTAISTSNCLLEPINSGPPYNRVEINLGTSSAFGVGSTQQRNLALTGVWGYNLDEDSAGSLGEALDGSETAIDVLDSSILGVGSIFRVDSERMVVTNKSWLDSTQNLQTPLTALANNETVAVTDGTKFYAGEVILLDSERMFIVDVAGNNLSVKRAWDGTILATHTGSDIYAPRTLTVTRGALGTTAATHADAAPVYKHKPPALVKKLNIAEALVAYQEENAGYAKSTSNNTPVGGIGIEGTREQVYNTYGRKARMASV